MSRTHARRSFLRGAGVTLALPFLPSALPKAMWSGRAHASTCTPPRRFMAWFVPNGMVMPAWTPTTAGTSTWAATPILSSALDPVRAKIAILTGLDHQDIAVPPGTAGLVGDHAAGTGCFLNMIPVSGHETDSARTSIDQALLPSLNSGGCYSPILPSLQVGVQTNSGQCDRANCSFVRSISWINGAPLPTLYDPGIIFDKLFGGPIPPTGDVRTRRQSVLDAVLAETQSLSLGLSAADRQRLDQHTTWVRNVETRLQRLGKVSPIVGPLACTPGPRPLDSPALNPDRGITPSSLASQQLPILVDLMGLAFQCDITRAITFMLGPGMSELSFGFLTGDDTGHHTLSEATGDAAALSKLVKIDNYEIMLAASLLARLDSIVEADGKTVLDHTTFYLGSDIADGQAHNHWDMPVLLAGGASGALKIDGRHINYIPQMPFPRPAVGPRSNVQTGRVFISILQAHGIMRDTFGLSSGGPLPELMP